MTILFPAFSFKKKVSISEGAIIISITKLKSSIMNMFNADICHRLIYRFSDTSSIDFFLVWTLSEMYD